MELPKSVLRYFTIYTVGVFLVFTGSTAIVALESSINIISAAGTNSLAASYITAIIFGILFCPVVIRLLGSRLTLLASQACYLVYIIANCFKEEWVLIIGGVIRGFGNGCMWPCFALLNAAFAEYYALTKQKDVDTYIPFFTSLFFIIVHLNQVLGNGLSYVILYVGRMTNKNHTMVQSNPSFPHINTTSLKFCGLNDCQNAKVVTKDISQYLPVTFTVELILLASFAAIKCIGMFINAFFSPGVFSFGWNVEDDLQNLKNEIRSVHEPPKVTKDYKMIWTEIKDIFKHSIDIQQLALVPISTYSGFLIGFVYNDLTRAYISCGFGVSYVGIGMSIFAVISAVASLVVAKLMRKTGRILFLVVALIVDTVAFPLCFKIDLTFGLWPVFGLFGLFGISVGAWQPVILATHLEYFDESKRTLASTSWNSWTVMGLFLNSVINPYICVWQKLWVLIGSLTIGLIGFGAAEYCFWSRRSTKNGERQQLIENMAE